MFWHDPAEVFVHEPGPDPDSPGTWGTYRSLTEYLQLKAYLNEKGIRENALLKAFKEYDHVLSAGYKRQEAESKKLLKAGLEASYVNKLY